MSVSNTVRFPWRWFGRFFAVHAIGLAVGVAGASAQVLDITFDPSPNFAVSALAVQPDGKILVGGGFTEIAGATNRAFLARLNVDGSLDTAFTPQINSAVQVLALQPDGKIIIGGNFVNVNNTVRQHLARLNADGSLDLGFDATVGEGALYALLLQPDGAVVLGGSFVTVGGQTRRGIARILSNGSLDTTFQVDVVADDPQFPAFVYCLARQADGAIILGGTFTLVKGTALKGAARVSNKGDLDGSFLPPFVYGAAGVSISSVVVQRDGKVVFGGGFSLPNDVSHVNLIRCQQSGGLLDTSFAPAPDGGVSAVVEDDDGGLFVFGSFNNIGGEAHGRLARLRSDGSVVKGFNFDLSNFIFAAPAPRTPIGLAGQGRVVFGGSFTKFGGVTRNALARVVPAEPNIISQPASVSVASGATTTLSVSVLGSPPTYQWRKDGVALAGATGASLTLNAVRPQDAGRYDVLITNSAGATTSNVATLTVNFAPIIATQPAAVSVVSGQPAVFSVGATAFPPPTYQWRRDGMTIPGASQSQLTLAATKAADAGSYQCVVANEFGTVTTAAAELAVVPRARLGNLSVRTTLARGESVLVGFVVAGGVTDMVVRAAGPALQQFGLTTAMADPRLELYREATKIFENDNWPSSLAPVFTRVGAFPFAANSLDAGLQQTVGGAHSIVASGSDSGVVLVEAYDAGTVEGPRLANLSARNRVGVGDDVLIVGFSVTGAGTMRVLLRAVGPTLGGVPFNLPGVLADPKLELRNAGGQLLGENDNWDAGLAATFASVGAFGLAPGGKDAALVAQLTGGNSYTAVVKGADGGTGAALVEIYEVP